MANQRKEFAMDSVHFVSIPAIYLLRQNWQRIRCRCCMKIKFSSVKYEVILLFERGIWVESRFMPSFCGRRSDADSFYTGMIAENRPG